MHRLRVMLTALFLCFFAAVASAGTQIVALDVGEGQAILIKHHNEALLIDTGHAGQAHLLLSKLNNYGIEKLNSIILTHLHPDHASAYFRLVEAFPSALIYSNCHPLTDNIQPDMTRWVHDSLNNNPQHSCLKAGDNLAFHNAKLHILWPEHFINHNLNLHSLVINIHIENKNTLVMGDAGFAAEKKLVSEKKLPDPLHTLVVGHHGENDATSKVFLQAAKPQLAIISVNKNNIRGYPSEQTVQRLNSMGIKVLRTDRQGDIEIQ